MSRDAEMSALERLIREGSDADVKRFFLLLRPPELADLLERIPDEDRLRVLRLMSAPLASEVLREVHEGERDEILDEMPAQEIAEIVHESRSDDAADLVGAVSPDKQERILDRLDEEERAEIQELLEYGEETAGGIMQTEVVTVRGDVTSEQALAEVRRADEEEVGEIHQVYVVDADGRLVAALSPSDLLHAEPAATVRDIARPDPVKIPVGMDQEEIVCVVKDNDLAAVPVVDENGLLLGQVLHDDVADVIEEEATEDIAKMAGADPEELYGDSVMLSVRSRAPWLIPAFVGGLGASVIIRMMEEDLAAAKLLAAFLPVVIGMAGNVGTQASVITVRSIALGRVEFSGGWRMLLREGLTGVILGTVFGVLLYACALLIGRGVDDLRLYALTLSLAIFISMAVGTVFGVVVPLTLDRVRIDPAIATTPFVQTSMDVIGVALLFLVANAVGLIG